MYIVTVKGLRDNESGSRKDLGGYKGLEGVAMKSSSYPSGRQWWRRAAWKGAAFGGVGSKRGGWIQRVTGMS